MNAMIVSKGRLDGVKAKFIDLFNFGCNRVKVVVD